MDKMKPKLCINSSCRNVIYVPDNMLHMCLQCETCTEKLKGKEHDYIEHNWNPDSEETVE